LKNFEEDDNLRRWASGAELQSGTEQNRLTFLREKSILEEEVKKMRLLSE